jgi:hypothetical protein
MNSRGKPLKEETAMSIIRTTKLGMEVFLVLQGSAVIAQFLSEAQARTLVLKGGVK